MKREREIITEKTNAKKRELNYIIRRRSSSRRRKELIRLSLCYLLNISIKKKKTVC